MNTSSIDDSAFGIADSPRSVLPSASRAPSVTLASVEGRISPRTASTREVSRIASSIFPVTLAIATRKRLPKEWPAIPSPASSPKRYWNSSVTSGSASESAAMQLRMSPGGIMSISRRSRPLEPPSSATVTTAVRFAV